MTILDPASSPHTVLGIPPGPYAYVPRQPVPDPTPLEACDTAVAELRAAADRWVHTAPERKRDLLDEVLRATEPLIGAWTRIGSLHEGLDPDGPNAAEETIVGPYVFMRGVRLHRRAVEGIIRTGTPRIPGGVRTLPDGRVAARVMPADWLDAFAYLGMTADVWMEPGVTAETLPGTMASAWRTPRPGRVCLVLGAGNASSIGPLDAIHKLFVEQQVVVLKLHPVMAHLAEVQAAALAPLIREGVVRIIVGDAVQGGYLAHHPGVDTLHITGADRTYDAIVYGTGPEGEDRKRRDDPVLDKPFSAELGNLTPIIVVPGRWSTRDLDLHAENITSMLTNNAGFNCTTSRVIITARDWPQRGALLDRIRRRLGQLPPRLAYYPGAIERFSAFNRVHPEAELFGTAAHGELPWMLIPGLSPDASADPCYHVEAFCSVTAETPIDATDAETFLDRATAFANERLWGTLNATLIVDSRTARDPSTRPALERAIRDLRYGTVSLNTWSAAGYGIGITPWGAHPGNPRHDIGSGTGFVHNPLMFERAEKTVIRGPFRPWPKPPWFSSHRGAHRLMPELTRFEADKHPGRLLPILWYAIRG
jgi:acyl-CoA reductase-like NAD-dependent aldehyde dehydrogenase